MLENQESRFRRSPLHRHRESLALLGRHGLLAPQYRSCRSVHLHPLQVIEIDRRVAMHADRCGRVGTAHPVEPVGCLFCAQQHFGSLVLPACHA